MTKNQSGVYEIVNIVNGKRYIGSTSNFKRRWTLHCYDLKRGSHHGAVLQRAWNKYGATSFKFNILLICAKDRDILQMYEQQCFDAFKPEYNSAPIAGSSLGIKRSAKTKAKLSVSSTGNKNAVGSKSRRGQKNTPEHCAAISAGKMGRSVNIGHPCSSETRAKISKGNRGKVRSPEMRAVTSLRQKGKPKPPRTPEHIANNAASTQAYYARKRLAKYLEFLQEHS